MIIQAAIKGACRKHTGFGRTCWPPDRYIWIQEAQTALDFPLVDQTGEQTHISPREILATDWELRPLTINGVPIPDSQDRLQPENRVERYNNSSVDVDIVDLGTCVEVTRSKFLQEYLDRLEKKRQKLILEGDQ